MKIAPLSIRFSLGIVISLMGVMGLLLALATGEVYRLLALESQRSSLSHLVHLESRELLKSLEGASRDLGMAAQVSPAFKEAYAGRDAQALTQALNNHFNQYFVTAGVLKLIKLAAYDEAFNLIAQSSDAQGEDLDMTRVCARLLSRARQRRGSQRLKTLSDLCLHQGVPYHGLVVPIGGLRVNGYLLVITDPVHNLIVTEHDLDMPVRMLLNDATPVYKSDTWPGESEGEGRLLVRYTLRNGQKEPVLSIEVLNDIHELNSRLSDTRYLVMSLAALVTSIAVFIAFVVFEKTTLRPLKALSQSVRQVREDRTHLSQPVSVKGNREIRRLASDFNAMAGELNELYTTLERMAYTDSLTELPNRSLFNDRLEQATRLGERLNTKLALFMMDLNRFKDINDSLGHAVGDELLREVGLRFKRILRKSDTVGLLSEGMIARLGGDEFAAILPTVRNIGDASVVALKLKSAIDPPMIISGHALSVGVSIGIALFPQHGSNAQTLMRHADVAMYRAKRKGLDFVVYESQSDSSGLT